VLYQLNVLPAQRLVRNDGLPRSIPPQSVSLSIDVLVGGLLALRKDEHRLGGFHDDLGYPTTVHSTPNDGIERRVQAQLGRVRSNDLLGVGARGAFGSCA
jgi:hypothetical protein